MSGGLPSQIDSLDLAKNRVSLVGEYVMAEMPRLSAYSPSKDASIHVKLGFRLNSETLIEVNGSVEVVVRLTCERCLQPFDLELSLEPELFLDLSGQPIDETDERDIIKVNGPVDLQALVEDEVLLAIPMIPMHDPEQCRARRETAENGSMQVTDGGKNSPFAQLADLLNRKD